MQDAADIEEAERLKAEAEQVRLAEEGRRAEEQAERTRQAAEENRQEAERKKAESEQRAAQELADRLAAEQVEKERGEAEAKLIAEEKEASEAEAKRLAKEQAAKNAAEAERLAQEQAAHEAEPAVVEAKAAKPESAEPAPEPQGALLKETSWFNRLKGGLSRSSSSLNKSITGVFTKKKLDDDTLQDLEDILIRADLGVETATSITDKLAAQRMGKDVSSAEVRGIMADEIEAVLEPVAAELELDLDHQPHVILVVGVNGSGKTTTIGKLSQKLYDAGFSTLLVAGDTFRAAAIEQLKIWGDRTQSPVLSRPLGADAAGLAFDAYEHAKAERRDVMLMDTAGRLQNRTELMDELAKIVRVLKKQDPDAPHTVLLTLDATTGQNALNQVEIFRDIAGVNGLVMTKLDGTARGGILVAISAKYGLPVFFLGVGEQVDDLEPFEAKDFARSIAGLA
ncbi:MAG: signal recognition particle-docking protein FtsY [Rhizobiaceae bacterium]